MTNPLSEAEVMESDWATTVPLGDEDGVTCPLTSLRQDKSSSELAISHLLL
jgi:hypothetical protein